MKKLLLVVLLTTLSINTWAQSDKGWNFIEKMMIDALKKKHSPDEFYHCEVNKKAVLGDLKSIRYSYDKKFYFGDYNYKEGSLKNSDKWKLLYFEFLPYSDLYEYLYSKASPFDTPFSDLTSEGSVWMYTGGVLKNLQRDRLHERQTDLIPMRRLFYEMDHVKWSGDIVDGFIDGVGTGVLFSGRKEVQAMCFKGKFKKGFPVGKVICKYYNLVGSSPIPGGELKYTLSAFANDQALLTDAKGNKIAMIDKRGIGHLIPEEDNEFNRVWSAVAFKSYYGISDLKTLSTDKIKKMEVEYVLRNKPDEMTSAAHLPSGQFAGKSNDELWIELVTKQCLSMLKGTAEPCFTSEVRKKRPTFSPSLISKSKIATYWRSVAEKFEQADKPGARNLIQLMDVVDGYYLSQNEQLLRDILFTRSIIFFIPSPYKCLLESNYWDVIHKAVETAEKLKSVFPANSSMFTSVQAKLRAWDKKTLQIKDEAARWQVQQDREEKESYEAYLANMCDKCKIDAKKTTFPSGYSEGWSFLIVFGRPAESETNGKIELVNGEKIKWKYVYPDDSSPYISISGDYSGTYDSVDEMMKAIVEECKRNYCR